MLSGNIFGFPDCNVGRIFHTAIAFYFSNFNVGRVFYSAIAVNGSQLTVVFMLRKSPARHNQRGGLKDV